MNTREIHTPRRHKLPPLPLLHHLANSNNLPFARVAALSARTCRWPIIEFVPKSDSQVDGLLLTREDTVSGYTQHAFESEFGKHFTMSVSIELEDSNRSLYLMVRKTTGL